MPDRFQTQGDLDDVSGPDSAASAAYDWMTALEAREFTWAWEKLSEAARTHFPTPDGLAALRSEFHEFGYRHNQWGVPSRRRQVTPDSELVLFIDMPPDTQIHRPTLVRGISLTMKRTGDTWIVDGLSIGDPERS